MLANISNKKAVPEDFVLESNDKSISLFSWADDNEIFRADKIRIKSMITQTMTV